MGLGLFEGIFPARARERRASALDKIDYVPQDLVSELPDPEAAKAFNDRQTELKRLAHSGDEMLQRQAIVGLSELGQQVQNAYAQDREKRGTFVVETLRDQRTRYTANAKAMREVDSNMGELDSLLSDKNFDPDKPVNAGQLLKLIHSGPRQVFDPQDMADAIGRVSGGGLGPLALLGPIAALISGEMKADQFKMSKAEWRTLAAASYQYTMKPLKDESDHIVAGATALEPVANRLGLFPQGYSPLAYVTEQKVDFAPTAGKAPAGMTAAPVVAPNPRVQETAKEFTQGIKEAVFGRQWNEQHADFKGPPAMVEASQEPALSGLAGFGARPLFGQGSEPGTSVIEKSISGSMENYIKPYRDDGATILTDPTTGETFADYANGRRVRIELPALGKFLMKSKAGTVRNRRDFGKKQ